MRAEYLKVEDEKESAKDAPPAQKKFRKMEVQRRGTPESREERVSRGGRGQVLKIC